MKKTSKTSKSRKSKKGQSTAVLATCPIGASGWCAYPFSLQQLEKRMKKTTEEPKAKQLAGVGA